mmetsp:Transcript_45083/g.72455  ORF Transcript_45083/g.72455 Transcript_45083/m.72455 type:complete len:366 (+) Transcript_45083:337-1434(+)
MQYSIPQPDFHTFEIKGKVVGFRFFDPNEAKIFASTVKARLGKMLQEKIAAMESKDGSRAEGRGRKKSQYLPFGIGKKIKSFFTKEETKKVVIGRPTDFKHVAHIGYDEDTGFDVKNIPDAWKNVFKAAGISKKQLKNKQTAKVLYKTIQQQMESQNGSDNQPIAHPSSQYGIPNKSVPPPPPPGGPRLPPRSKTPPPAGRRSPAPPRRSNKAPTSFNGNSGNVPPVPSNAPPLPVTGPPPPPVPMELPPPPNVPSGLPPPPSITPPTFKNTKNQNKASENAPTRKTKSSSLSSAEPSLSLQDAIKNRAGNLKKVDHNERANEVELPQQDAIIHNLRIAMDNIRNQVTGGPEEDLEDSDEDSDWD